MSNHPFFYMGILSGKKKIYVSSTVYNLAGEEDKIANYLELVVLQSVLTNSDIASTLQGSYLYGQGVKTRNAYRYARDYYTLGLGTGSTVIATLSDTSAIKDVISKQYNSSDTVVISSAVVATAQYEWWARQYMVNTYGFSEIDGKFHNPPSGVEEEANYTYDINSANVIEFTFTNADGTKITTSFSSKDFDQIATYISVTYNVISGPTITTNTTTHKTESSDEEGTTTNSYGYWNNGKYYAVYVITITTLEPNNITSVTTKTTVGETNYSYYFMYKIGSNTEPTLEALVSTTTLASPFYPIVPMRVWGRDMTNDVHKDTDLYKTSKKLLKKLGVSINDVADTINNNESIDDIDFAYIVFGVNLNTTLDTGKVYIYYFLKYLQSIQTYTEADWKAWLNNYETYKTEYAGAKENETVYLGEPKTNSLSYRTDETKASALEGVNAYYQSIIEWQFIKSETITGTISNGATKGDILITHTESDDYSISYTTNTDESVAYKIDNSVMTVLYQVSATQYEKITVIGLYHKNYVYHGKYVGTSVSSAFADEDNTGDSGFLLPLNYTVLENMNLVDFTQLTYAATHIVFSSYQVVKKKWYQTGVFKVVVVVAAAVVTYFFPPAGIAAMGAAIATAVGVSIAVGLLIAVIGSAVAAMIIATILNRASTAVFGDGVIGQVIGTVVTIITMYYAGQGLSNMATTTTSTASTTTTTTIDGISTTSSSVGATTTASTFSLPEFNNMASVLTALNLNSISGVTSLASAAQQVFSAYVTGESNELSTKTDALTNKYNKLQKQIKDAADELDWGTVNINPEWLTTANYVSESSSAFLARTTMTGSDVIDITLGVIHDFVNLNNQLDTYNS